MLDIAWGESKSAFGLEIVFNGGATVNYENKPPAGSVLLGLKHGGKEDSAVWMDYDWGEPHQAFGFTYRVLNQPELKPRTVRIEVERPKGTG